jgi:solute carrier family 13 (sodium-dependent dicarboxylate transporter), member 2/3/5
MMAHMSSPAPPPGTLGKNTVNFLVSLVAALALTLLIREPAFTDSQNYVLFLLFFAIGLWLTEAVPPFAVGLFIMAYLVFALGNPNFNSAPEDIARYVNTFSSSIVWLMLGGFFIAEAMTKTKLDADLLRITMRLSGTTPRGILLGLMLTTMIGSMLMSNTATTAMVIASVMPLLASLGKGAPFAKALLVGIPIAASTGGMATIIGTPPNAIAAGALENAGIELDFLHWMYYGLPLAIALTMVSWLVLVGMFVKDNRPISLDFTAQDAGKDGTLKRQRTICLVIITVTLLLWITSSLHNVSVSAVSAIPIVFLTMTGILQGSDVRRLSWDTLLLVAGGLSLGVALQQSGLLTHYANRVVDLSVPDLVFVWVLAYVTMVFSNIMSHTATSTVLVPLGMTILAAQKAEIAIIIALSSSTALMLPVSSPPNAIAYATGLVELKDFRIGGLLLGLVGPAMIIVWVLLLT